MEPYNTTDQKLHWLSQIIAKANRTFIPAKSDDSHTTFYFDPIENRLLGQWIEIEQGKLILSLNLTLQNFQWLNEQFRPLASVTYNNKTMEQIEADIVESMLIMGFNHEGFTNPMHYEIPQYDFMSGEIDLIDAESITQWVYYRTLANEACQLVLGHLQSAGDVKIWPHHFDTGTYTEHNNQIGIGFGLAMQDNMVEAPYFYLAGYPLNKEKLNFLNLPDITPAYWELGEDWKGAILPLNHIEEFKSKSSLKILYDYISRAIAWYLRASA